MVIVVLEIGGSIGSGMVLVVVVVMTVMIVMMTVSDIMQ